MNGLRRRRAILTFNVNAAKLSTDLGAGGSLEPEQLDSLLHSLAQTVESLRCTRPAQSNPTLRNAEILLRQARDELA